MTNRTPFLAAAWALGTGGLALWWTATGDGYPFGVNNPDDILHPLRAVPPAVGAPIFAVVLLAAGVLALATAGRHPVHPPRSLRAILLGFGWATVGALLVVVPGTEVLTFAGYAPILILGAPFGWPPVDYSELVDAQILTEVSSVVGGLLLLRTLLAWQRRTGGACVACGRDTAPGRTSAAAAARWVRRGRWAAYVAAAIPAIYAVTRLAWLAGITMGIPAEFLTEMRDNGMVWAGAGLGAFALLGSVLTLGLVQRWGEVFPRWMVGLAGRRVPIRLATVPATIVAVAVASASMGFFSNAKSLTLFVGGPSAATLPMALWPLWSVALIVATYAYHLRRRGRCETCGRDDGGQAETEAAASSDARIPSSTSVDTSPNTAAVREASSTKGRLNW
jgi:hypothetical protein